MALNSGVQVHKIRAAVLRKRGGPLRIESLEMEGPRDDEVLVRTVASGVCTWLPTSPISPVAALIMWWRPQAIGKCTGRPLTG